MRRLFAVSLAPIVLACLPEPPAIDLDPPQVVASSLGPPRSVELPVVPELVVELSEPLDPDSVHPGSVALIAWALTGESCTLTPACEDGSCERGRCQEDPLSASERAAIDAGEHDAGSESAVVVEILLEPGEAGPDTRVRVIPRRPLDPRRRHALIVGTAVRDRSGAPLADAWGRSVAWRRDFVTASEGSAGPQPRLVLPAPGQLAVPTNLAFVETAVWPPVPAPRPGAVLWLEARDGGPAIELIEPRDCPGWVPGTCLRWRPATLLRSATRLRPAGGTLVDRFDRPALPSGIAGETWFEVGAGPDEQPPTAELVAQIRGRCLAVWVDVGEPVEAALEVEGRTWRAAIPGSGWLGLELAGEPAPEQSITWTVELRDLAGNVARHDGAIAAGPGFRPDLGRVRITEVLANPAGPEPDAEFVEIEAGPDGLDLDGVRLADVAPAQLWAAWIDGDEPPGDPLPAVSLAPGELAIVVGSGWTRDNEDDPAPPLDTRILPVDASLGTSGLKNAGEPITLWTMTEQGPVALASYASWIDTGAASHAGRSVVAGADACDLPDRWRSHPLGRSTPGATP